MNGPDKPRVNAAHLPSVEFLRRKFAYNPDTGLLRRKGYGKARAGVAQPDRPGSFRVAMRFAGPDGARVQVRVSESRVIWAMVTGEWPAGDVGHIDSDPSNNRWSNLRLSGHTVNIRNRRVRKDSKTGVRCLRLVQRFGEAPFWLAKVVRGGKVVFTKRGADRAPVEAALADFLSVPH